MMDHRGVRTVLYEYVRGELVEGEEARVREHLARCPRCSREHNILKRELELVPLAGRKPSDERSEEFWRSFAANVERRIKEQRRTRPAFGGFLDQLSLLWLSRRSQFAAAGGVALVLLAALLWITQSESIRSPENEATLSDENAVVPAHQEMNDYFRKSKILLVGISNMSTPSGQPVDLSSERRIARGLIQKARLLEAQASDERATELINQLERILIELANMEEQVDLKDVELLRSGIRQENLLFKVRMAEEQLGRRGEPSLLINF